MGGQNKLKLDSNLALTWEIKFQNNEKNNGNTHFFLRNEVSFDINKTILPQQKLKLVEKSTLQYQTKGTDSEKHVIIPKYNVSYICILIILCVNTKTMSTECALFCRS